MLDRRNTRRVFGFYFFFSTHIDRYRHFFFLFVYNTALGQSHRRVGWHTWMAVIWKKKYIYIHIKKKTHTCTREFIVETLETVIIRKKKQRVLLLLLKKKTYMVALLFKTKLENSDGCCNLNETGLVHRQQGQRDSIV